MFSIWYLFLFYLQSFFLPPPGDSEHPFPLLSNLCKKSGTKRMTQFQSKEIMSIDVEAPKPDVELVPVPLSVSSVVQFVEDDPWPVATPRGKAKSLST